MTPFAQAWRSLRRRPAFTLATLLTLAVGLAVTTAAFAIVDAVLLKSLPYPSAHRLVTVMEASPSKRQRVSLAAPARIADWNRESQAFEGISGSYAENVTDTSGSEPERLEGRRVLPRFFDVYGRAPIAGRTFTAEEEQFGGPLAAVISEGFWTRRFARDPSAVGRHLTVAGVSCTIVGVMPRDFAAPKMDVWIPAQLSPQLMRVREARFITGIGRLRAGVSIEQARADLSAVQARLAARYPKSDEGWSADVQDLKLARVGAQRAPLAAVFGAVALLFAIALANIAALMLVQLRRRQTEFAVRSAIGASRRQVIGSVAREVLLLAAGSIAAGLALTVVLLRVAVTALSDLPRMTEVTLDWRVVAFASLLSVIAAFAAGLVPAWAATRRASGGLIATTRVAGGRHRVQAFLVAAQMAIGVVLAGSAALLVRTYAALNAVDLGFDSAQVLTFHVAAAWDEDRLRVGQLQQQLLDDISRLPSVRSAGFTNFLPGTSATLRSQVRVAGINGPEANGSMTVGTRTISPQYLQAIRVPLVSGRWCSASALNAPEPREVLVNRRFADVYANGLPLEGRRLSIVQEPGAWTIAGVVGDVIEDGASAPSAPYIYVCMPYGSWPDPEYVVRADGDPRALVGAIRQVVKRLDSSRPLFAIQPLAAATSASLDQPRLNAAALSAFSAGALALVGIGLYALLALSVAERRREFGVRLALGATPSVLRRLVFVSTARIVAGGVAGGAILLALAGRMLHSLLFGVTAYDPIALGGAGLVLLALAMAAAAMPVRRAAAVSPIEALRD